MIDILIVGSGPAGLAAAIYAKRANKEVLVVEKEFQGMGQIINSHRVDNYPGFPGISGYNLGEHFRNHALDLGIKILEEEIFEISKALDGWKVKSREHEIKAKCIIYAAGATARHLKVPGEEKFLGRGVSYCASCDGAFYKGKNAAVVGGGDTALDDALLLSDMCKKVYLIHRREEFRGFAKTLEMIRQKENIEIITNANVKEIKGRKKVENLELDIGENLKVDGVFIAIGMMPVTEPLKKKFLMDEDGYLLANEDGKTSVEGFFVAGDVRKKQLKQIVTAVSDGANAAYSAVCYLIHKDRKD